MVNKNREMNLRSKANKASSSTSVDVDVDVDVDGMIMGRCNIPEEIIVEILSRLPAQSILQCQQVCKAWRDLLRHPSFAQIHLLRRRRLISSEEELDNDHADTGKELGFVYFDVSIENPRSRILSYAEYDEISNKTLITKMHHPSTNAELICSSYGLIGMSFADSCLYICNPITDEYTLLPKQVNYHRKASFFMSSRIAVGFGYHPSTNQYKAVRICCCCERYPYPSRVEVYTLGAGSGWRDIGEFNFYSFNVEQRGFTLPGKLANGAIHWLCKKGKILAFDLADEELRYLSLPSCFSPHDDAIKRPHDDVIQLLVLGGRLCVGLYNGDAKSVKIWSLKKSGEWEIMFRVASHQGMNGDNFVPLALVKRGEVLSSYNDKFLCRHDPKTGTIENLVQFGECPSSLARHMYTFVSLKGLGEKVGIISRTSMLCRFI